jgi:hypothetical protein
MVSMRPRLKRLALLSIALATAGCFPRGPGGRLLFAMAGTAIVTAAVISAARPPPPPRVVYVPEPRPGYTWQPGYWILEDNRWVWIEGRWIALAPGYEWSPAHWEQDPSGTWRLVPGHWMRVPPPP